MRSHPRINADFWKDYVQHPYCNIVISIKKEGVAKRKKRAWWKQKSERIAQRKFGGFELATRHHSARLFWNPIMRI